MHLVGYRSVRGSFCALFATHHEAKPDGQLPLGWRSTSRVAARENNNGRGCDGQNSDSHSEERHDLAAWAR